MRFIFILLLCSINHAFAQSIAPELQGSRWYYTKSPLQIAQLKGQVILLDFWGVWCKPCIAAIPELKKLQADLKDDPFLIITIHTPNKSDQFEDFSKEHDFDFVTMVDQVPPGEKKSFYGVTINRYQVQNFPAYILIDKKGQIVGGIRGHIPELAEIRKLLK